MKNLLIASMCLVVMVGCTAPAEEAASTEAAGGGEMQTASMVTCDKCGMSEKESSASVVDGQTLCSHCK